MWFRDCHCIVVLAGENPFSFHRENLLRINLVTLTDEGFTSLLLRWANLWIRVQRIRTPLKIGKLGENSQLWYRKYIYLNYSGAAQEIKVEKQFKISAFQCKVGVETIVWKEIEIMKRSCQLPWEPIFPERPSSLIFPWNFTSNDDQKYWYATNAWKNQ